MPAQKLDIQRKRAHFWETKLLEDCSPLLFQFIVSSETYYVPPSHSTHKTHVKERSGSPTKPNPRKAMILYEEQELIKW